MKVEGKKMTDKASIILYRLSDASTVSVELLSESDELFKMVMNGTPYEELLDWVNENF
jgi:hypothetical protein